MPTYKDVDPFKNNPNAIQLDEIPIEGEVPEEEDLLTTLTDAIAAIPSDNGGYGPRTLRVGSTSEDSSVQGVTPEAVAGGLGQAMTFGHSDEIAGAINSLLGGSYEEERDRARGRVQRAEETDPLGSGVGTALGAVPMMAAGGALGNVSGLGRGSRVMAATGAGLGAGTLAGSGHSAGDVGSDRWAADASLSGAIGGATAGAFSGAGEGLRAFGGMADDLGLSAARQRLRQATGDGGVRALRLMERRGPAREVAADLAEHGLLDGRPGPTAERALEEASHVIGGIDRRMADTVVPGHRVRNALRGHLAPGDFTSSAASASEAAKKMLERLGGGDIRFGDLRQTMRSVGREIRQGQANSNMTDVLYDDLYGVLRETIDEAVESRLGPEALRQLRSANRRFELARVMTGVSEDEARRAAARSPLSFGDVVTATAAGGAENPTQGAGAAIARRMIASPRVRATVAEQGERLARRAEPLGRAIGDASLVPATVASNAYAADRAVPAPQEELEEFSSVDDLLNSEQELKEFSSVDELLED